MRSSTIPMTVDSIDNSEEEEDESDLHQPLRSKDLWSMLPFLERMVLLRKLSLMLAVPWTICWCFI